MSQTGFVLRFYVPPIAERIGAFYHTWKICLYFLLAWSLGSPTHAVEIVARGVKEPALQLLQAGKQDEAFEALGWNKSDAIDLFEWSRRNEARSWIELAKSDELAGRMAEALCWYEAYLSLFPFGTLNWDDNVRDEW